MALIFTPKRTSKLHVSLDQRVRSVVVTAVILATLIACATATPQRIAFNSLQTIRTSVEVSLKVFNAGYQAGQFNDLQRTQLATLYGKYTAADKIAAEALLATTTTDPAAIVAQVTIIASDVLKFVQSLKGGP